jgi:GntR family transcriptional regulator/MocR family aminotransferase
MPMPHCFPASFCQTGHGLNDQSKEKHLTSRRTELLIGLDRNGQATLRQQIETQIREALRAGSLRAGLALPSSRELARQLAVSRPLVSDVYEQLAAEGYIVMRQGAVPVVAPMAAATHTAPEPAAGADTAPPRYDFRIGAPDLSLFPKSLWLKATGRALAAMEPAQFGYEDRHGVLALRMALADYLGRVRGIIASPDQIMINSGFEQGRNLAAKALHRAGITRIAIENPGYTNLAPLKASGLELAHIPVDAEGVIVDAIIAQNLRAALITPSHQYPTGALLSGERRQKLLAWLRDQRGFAVEDDYDAEFRYDRKPVAALQGLAPDAVIYAGTASKTLAPGLRLGWLVVPSSLLDLVQEEQRLQDYGVSRIEQHTLALFIASGDYDRHLRRMRLLYRKRRETLVAALAEFAPQALVTGISAGLHASVTLPARYDEAKLAARAAQKGIAIGFISRHRVGDTTSPTTILIGYAKLSETSIRAGIRSLGAILADI